LSPTASAAAFRARDLARDAGLQVSLDVNLRRRLWSDVEAAPVLRELATGVDVVLGSPDELAVIVDADPATDPADLISEVATIGPSTVVAKLAAYGALGLKAGGSAVHVTGLPVAHVVDPVGAGDAFCAGFIAGRLDGVDLETALRMGNACGALAVAAAGDQAGLPDRAEVARLLAGEGADTIR
jgi:2-dehydro-3-deoxygluconokinase